MGSKTFRSIYDFVRHDCDIQVVCKCGHKGIVTAAKANARFFVKRWPGAIEVAGAHFRCSRCGLRHPVDYRPCPRGSPPTFPNWGEPSEQTP